MEKCILNYSITHIDEITGQPYRLWDGMKIYDDEWHIIDKLIKKREKINYLYLTLSPDKFSRNLPIDRLDDLKDWCSKWFTEKNNFYRGGVYVIENGSKGDHLHVHALLKINNSTKHALKLKDYWSKYFPESPLLTSLNLAARKLKGTGSRGEYCYANITDRKILEDKLDYFTNDNKGFHENHSIIMQPSFFGESL
jgi:hypothetical protein